MVRAKLKVGVLISGRGSNLQALIDGADRYRIACVVSDRGDALALERARAAGIPAVFVDPRGIRGARRI
jgi:phosphoribosylglycinamide formyltransferase 1